jgi:RimJ/RimL family protein N-acetyltransferase
MNAAPHNNGLETDRFLIRPFVRSDTDAYARVVADPEVMRYLGGRIHSYEEAEEYVAECIAMHEEFGYSRYAVLLKDSGEFIGFCGFAHFNGELDFGWRYERRYWGKGYGTEAATAVLARGVEVLRFPLIVAIAYPENGGSIRIMQKIGMEFDGYGELNGKRVTRYVKTYGDA